VRQVAELAAEKDQWIATGGFKPFDFANDNDMVATVMVDDIAALELRQTSGEDRRAAQAFGELHPLKFIVARSGELHA
jgi:hypothetical protein